MAVFVDVPLNVVRIHRVRGKAHGVFRFHAALAIVLRHHVFGNHPPGFPDVELMRPIVGLGEFVLRQTEVLEMGPHLVRHARMIGERPHQPLLVGKVFAENALAGRVVAVGVVVVLADIVGGDREVVVGVGLAVRHENRIPRIPRIARIAVPQQQFVLQRVVVLRLLPRGSILRHVGRAHAEAIRLHLAVARAVDARSARLHTGQQTAGRVARFDVRINRFAELVMDGVFHLHAVERFAVDLVGLATDVIRNAGFRHHVAFVRAVDEDLAAKCATAFHGDGIDPCAGFLHAVLQVEPFVQNDLNLLLGQHLAENLLGDVRLERPHFLAVPALPTATVLAAFLPFPGGVVGVVAGDAAIKLARQPADGRLVPNIRRPQPPRRQPANVLTGFDENHGFPHIRSLHRRRHPSGGAAVDDDVIGGDWLGTRVGAEEKCKDEGDDV